MNFLNKKKKKKEIRSSTWGEINSHDGWLLTTHGICVQTHKLLNARKVFFNQNTTEYSGSCGLMVFFSLRLPEIFFLSLSVPISFSLSLARAPYRFSRYLLRPVDIIIQFDAPHGIDTTRSGKKRKAIFLYSKWVIAFRGAAGGWDQNKIKLGTTTCNWFSL